MKEINPYLNFDGDCRAAMTFYQQCLGGELEVMTFGDAPGMDSPTEAKERVMHARLASGAGVIMASDTMPGTPHQPGNNVHLSINCEAPGDVDRLHAALAEGGRSVMAPQDTFWGARFAMLTDRFGINWMLNAELARHG